MPKPDTAAAYTRIDLERARETCLFVATKIGDLLDEVVIVGGLVPPLLIEQDSLPGRIEPFPGTKDVDLGLARALLTEKRYQTFTDRLRAAGFEPDENERGNPTLQRWRARDREGVTIDFLVPPAQPGDRGGTLRHFESDFAALITPGLHLAFHDRASITLPGRTRLGEQATRKVWVCGPGAYVVLKALAFRERGENKDAFDLFYVLRYFGAGPQDVALRLRPLLSDDAARRAVDILQHDFAEPNGPGPTRAALFLRGRRDEDLQADVAGYVRSLIRLLAG